MDGQGYSNYLNSSRELSAFEMEIQMADSKAKVTEILDWVDLSEENFIEGFPDLAKKVRDLPDSPTFSD
ncbi:hypothetical protein ACF07B_00750 [Streptomyces sp. NPDC015532]|uniref:hypothetical protein n=1 Tax=Streptomyces sp. NPDC015532 TaxID=3364960 RepID=UPI0036F630FC